MKRFIQEYANYKLKNIKENKLMQEEFKEEKIERINKALRAIKNGFITIDETMNIIANV